MEIYQNTPLKYTAHCTYYFYVLCSVNSQTSSRHSHTPQFCTYTHTHMHTLATIFFSNINAQKIPVYFSFCRAVLWNGLGKAISYIKSTRTRACNRTLLCRQFNTMILSILWSPFYWITHYIHSFLITYQW